jgi:hypothetical protein
MFRATLHGLYWTTLNGPLDTQNGLDSFMWIMKMIRSGTLNYLQNGTQAFSTRPKKAVQQYDSSMFSQKNAFFHWKTKFSTCIGTHSSTPCVLIRSSTDFHTELKW